MKKFITLFAVSLTLLIASACNGQMDDSGMQDDNESFETSQNNVEEDVDTGDGEVGGDESEAAQEAEPAQDDDQYMRKKLEEVDFREIDIDIDYADRKEFEADIDYHESRAIEAKVENELNNELFRGKEAFDYIFDRIKDIDFSSGRSDADIIADIISAFDLPDDYQKFEIEIEFNDGTEREIEHRK